MRPAASLAAGRGGERLGDLAGLHPPGDQIIRDGHVNARSVPGREQHRDRVFVPGAEGVHLESDLAPVVQRALGDVELHVADPLHASRSLSPAAGLEQLLHPLFELPIFLEQRLDPPDEMLRLRAQHAGRRGELPLELVDERVGGWPRHRFDAPHPRRGARLVGEPEQRDLPGGGHVRPAAQLERHARHVHDAHDVAVLLSEERHGASGDRFPVLHLAGLDREVLPDVAVHCLFDVRQRGVAHRPVMREVEPQPVRRDHGPLLAHMAAEDLSQGGVYEVRRRVVALDVLPPPLVHLGKHRRRLELVLEAPDDGARAVHLVHVRHLQLPPCALHASGVADLAARLGIKWILPQHDCHLVLGLPKLQHIGLGLRRLVADPLLLGLGLHGAPLAGPPDHDARRVSLDLQGAGPRRAPRARPLALFLERLFEPRDVHGLPPLRGDQLGQIDREAVGVVQLERVVSRDDLRALQFLQARQPAFDRVEEPLLFGAGDALDVGALLDQFGIDVAHQLRYRSREVHDRRLAATEQPGVADRAAQDAAQHVAAALVRRIHAVRQQERHRPGVVGEDPVGGTALPAIVLLPDHLDRPRDDRREEIGVEVRPDALHHRGDAFQPGPRVHRGGGERGAGPVRLQVVLHEHQIPDLEQLSRLAQLGELIETEFPLALSRLPFPANIDEDLGARSRRARLPHLPEVVRVAQAKDARVGDPGDRAPQPARLVVGVVHADVESVGRDTEPVPRRHPFPSVFDGLLLEVVPEGKVAEHLEEGVMPGGMADLLEMLGNFSFGDYFKKEAIEYAWEWVTSRDWLGIAPDRLYVSVHHTDDEARRLWRAITGIADSRIFGLGDADNFWQMGETGPAGPCSEILVDIRGKGETGQGKGELSLNEFAQLSEAGQLLEIWNLVFMQYDLQPDGSRSPLPAPSVDTGAGLERIAAVMQGVRSNFDTDLFTPIIARAVEVIGKKYDRGEGGASYRVLADHARAVAFLLADGVYPSNEGRGYVLRRILRRAVRHAWLLGRREPTLVYLVHAVSGLMGNVYPELVQKRSHLESVTRAEEERFFDTIEGGLERLEQLQGAKTISGAEAFKLYDTYGFPIDLTQLIAAEHGQGVDLKGFESALEAQRERSRNVVVSPGTGRLKVDGHAPSVILK